MPWLVGRVLEVSIWVVAGCEDNLPLFPSGSPLSPGDLARFGRQLVAEVESRTMQSIETGL